MNMKIQPGPLQGDIRAITSKSQAHRSLICAALCQEETELSITDRSADIDATVDCLIAMGAEIRIEGGRYHVSPVQPCERVVLNCRESGSTLRFLLPAASALCRQVRVEGQGRLPQRPLSQLVNALSEKGVDIRVLCGNNGVDGGGNLPLELSGQPQNGIYNIEGNISSQYISGLLFMLPLLSGSSQIRLTTAMESEAYVDMTVQSLRRFGIELEIQRDGFGTVTGYSVHGGQSYRSPGKVEVEGDWSNASFFLAAGAMGPKGGVACRGLDLHSTQGDRAILAILKRMGAELQVGEQDGRSRIAVLPGSLRGEQIDVSQIPDLMPVLAVTACAAQGKTTFYNAERLRMKESDRIASTAALIRSLGGLAEEGEATLTVTGTGTLRGGSAESFGDHRIAMSAAVAAAICSEPVIIHQAEAVEKSYPGFYRDFRKLGGIADVI